MKYVDVLKINVGCKSISKECLVCKCHQYVYNKTQKSYMHQSCSFILLLFKNVLWTVIYIPLAVFDVAAMIKKNPTSIIVRDT